MVAEIRRKVRRLSPGWEEPFTSAHAPSSAFIRYMIEGRVSIYPNLIAELAAFGLKLELSPSELERADPSRLGSSP